MSAEESDYQRLSRAIQRQDDGVWAAYYSDDSGISIFATELEALRDAVGTSKDVVFWRFGDSLMEARA